MENEFILITGCMFSGKSKYLIDHFYGKDDVEAFMPALNDREEEIRSRAYPGLNIPCTKISDPAVLLKSRAKTLIVDEYQFLETAEHLKDVVVELKKRGKLIVFTGLDYDSEGKEWTNYTKLKGIAQEEKLTADCYVDDCKEEATRTRKLGGTAGKTVEIEGKEGVEYKPCCITHFNRR